MHYKIGVFNKKSVLYSVVITRQSNPPISQFSQYETLAMESVKKKMKKK